MSAGSSKFDCQKFSPNIFNKSKCQHCFRSKDQHSSEALENNRASRKISKCGYLFVAPDWDFSIPMNRTKRWQRRWFVLYEDGELTYSVDEHPDTIPQAIIDMTKVGEVSDAEDTTGNKFSLAIAATDKTHFVKGTCKEESRWWFDVLVIYPRNLNGRLKRNVTLPSVKSTPNISQSGMKTSGGQQEVRIGGPRPRFNSCHSEVGGMQDDEPLRDSTSSALNTSKSLLDRSRDDALDFSNREQKENGSADDSLNGDRFGRSRRYQRRDGKKVHGHRSKSLGAAVATTSSSSFPHEDSAAAVDTGGTSASPSSYSVPRVPSPLYLRLSDVPLTKRYDSLERLQHDENGPLSPKSHSHADDEADSGKGNDEAAMQSRNKVVDPVEVLVHNMASQPISSSSSRSRRRTSTSSSTSTACSSRNSSVVGHSFVKDAVDEPWRDPEHQIRGDPDGCGLDHMVRCPSTIPEIRVDRLDYPAEEYLNIKKGWLMKMEMIEEWKKRWCVLMGSLFTVYLDSAQEDIGKPSVVMHMDHVQHIEEVEVGRNYGLKIKMVDGNCHIFSAVTATFRSNWIYALKNAANASGLGPSNVESKQLPLLQQKAAVSASEERAPCSVKSIVTPALSSDNEKWTVTGALLSDRNSSSSSNRVTNVNKGVATGNNQPRNLPPSPPLNRTVISKVKERARLKTNVRVSSRTTRASSSKATSGETEHSEVMTTGNDDQEARRIGSKEGTAAVHVKEISRSPGKLFSARLKDKSRRYTLPGRLSDAPDASDVPPDSRINLSRSSSRTARLLRDKNEVKLRGDIHCSSIHERDRLIEVLEGRLQKSEGKLFDLRNEMERMLKSRDDTQLRLHAELSLKELENERLRLDLLPDDSCAVDVKIVEEKSEEIGREEMSRLRDALDRANGDLVDVVNKLQATVDENETLRKLMMVDMVVAGGDSKNLVSRVDSLSDLTNIGDETDVDAVQKEAIVEKYAELRARFEKAINEIKCLRRELKEAHGRCDGLEVDLINQKQCSTAMNDDYRSQLRLMSDRIEDLTSKLSNSEKQLRQLTKQKSGKLESKEQRRTRSLKGREALTVSKEVENKVDELERKLLKVEGLLKVKRDVLTSAEPQLKAAAVVSTDAVDSRHIFVRLNSLESKVSGVIGTAETVPPPQSPTYSSRLDEDKEGGTPVTLISELNSQIEELKSRTTDLEMALLGFREKIEKCKDLLEIAATSANTDRQECLSNVGRHLVEALRWLDGSNIGVEASNMAAFFSRISAGMSEIVKSRLTSVHHGAKSEEEGASSNQMTQQVCLSKKNQESNMLTVLARSIPIGQCDSFDHRHVILEHSLALLKVTKTVVSSLENSSEIPSWIVGHISSSSSSRRDCRASELDIANLVKEMKEMEGTVGNLVNSWREKWRQTFVASLKSSANGNVSIISEEEFRDLPTVRQANECFINARNTLTQKLAEVDVVAVVSNALHLSGSSILPDVVSWLQRLLDRRTKLVIEAINRQEEEFISDVRVDYKEARESRHVDDHQYRHVHPSKQRICSEQEFANAIVQLTFLFVCLPFLSSLLEKGDWPTKSRTFGFHSPPLPRVVGELVKPEFRFEIPNKTANGEANETTASASSKETSLSDAGCKQCKELQRKVQQMAEKYATDLLLETERRQAKLEVLYQKHADDLTATEASHQERERRYCDEVQSLQGKLNSLEEDYERQVFSLKELFEYELSKRTDVKINKANVQLKYRAEIDQLKGLCEKGLVAMEHSHRRVVAELEEKHRMEMERLCKEKEQALADETHATLAALDAMRKAHEAELQKEVANFKDEFLRKMGRSSAADLNAIHREHQEELETIKREILLLSENYSVKCLECAALEEHVEVVTNQLSETNSLIFDLTARNKQLNSHLKQSMRDLSSLSRDANVNLLSSRDPLTMKELKIHLKLKDSQLIEKDEEIAELNRKLAATKNQQNELENQCRLLDASVKAGNRSCEEEMGTLRTRLENIIMSSGTCSTADGLRRKAAAESVSAKQQIAYNLAEPKAKQKVIIGSNVRARELMRSPSCPGLNVGSAEVQSSSSSSSSSIASPTTPPLLMYNKASGSPSAPMVGVVASRKKIFEHPEQ